MTVRELATRFTFAIVGMLAVASLSAYVTLRSQLHNRLDSSLLERAHLLSRTHLIQRAT